MVAAAFAAAGSAMCLIGLFLGALFISIGWHWIEVAYAILTQN